MSSDSNSDADGALRSDEDDLYSDVSSSSEDLIRVLAEFLVVDKNASTKNVATVLNDICSELSEIKIALKELCKK